MPPRNLPELKPREQVSDLEHIYGELKRAIMMGEFEPGQKLKLDDLAKAFGTSHMPVREALNRLVVARVLEAEPRRSMSIPKADHKRLNDLISLRTDLESKALVLAMRSANGSFAGLLDKINKGMDSETTKKKPNVKSYLALNQRFHFTMYEFCDNDELLNIIELLWMRYGPLLNLLRRGTLLISRHVHHYEIVEAVRVNDPAAATAALTADLNEAAAMISEIISERVA